MPVRPQLFGSVFCRQLFHVLQHDTVVRLFTGAGDHVSPDNIEVAGDGPENAFGVGNTRYVSALHVGFDPPDDGGGLAGGIQPGRLHDLVLRQPGNFSYPFRRVLFDTVLQLIKSMTPFFDKILVIELLFNDDVQPTQRQRRVSAWP